MPLVRGRDASRGIRGGRGRSRGFRGRSGRGGISVPVEHLEDEAETESEARSAVVSLSLTKLFGMKKTHKFSVNYVLNKLELETAAMVQCQQEDITSSRKSSFLRQV